ncbi:MAG: hypothetical protein HGA22_09090, partial [Clostridiales bacterium]|nr:hypothetical protein [Clostridiales bacterium]
LKSTSGGIVCKLYGAATADCQDTSILAMQNTNFFGDFKFDGLENGDYVIEVTAADRKTSINVSIAGESKNLGFIKL